MAYIKFYVNEKIANSTVERITQDYPEYIVTKSIAGIKGESELSGALENEDTIEKSKKYQHILSVMCGIFVFLFIFYGLRTELPEEITSVFEGVYINIGEGYKRAYAMATETEPESDYQDTYEKKHDSSQYISLTEQDDEEQEPTGENSFFGSMLEKNNLPEKQTQTTASVFSEQESIDESASVMAMNLSRGSDIVYNSNETGLAIDTENLSKQEYPIKAEISDEPLVLILHTHGTECYIDSTQDGNVRSTDKNRNVVRIGRELAEILNNFGIPTIHSETMHDELSYITAYNSSKKEAQDYLSRYPGIKYIIDLHRDALPDNAGKRVKGVYNLNGESTAQLMFVVGTNAGGGNHPGYIENLTVASHIQAEMNSLYPSLARPINIRNVVFNQNICSGSFILEVGSDANTLDEALSAIALFGRAFAGTILENSVL